MRIDEEILEPVGDPSSDPDAPVQLAWFFVIQTSDGRFMPATADELLPTLSKFGTA